ncbi:hypothetical protein SAMN05421770_106100 [Granulicella rosea]|uniref:WD40-like Beta Propeller Repeat n=1 Tax=Granulicella rosea TaxID=474952 RepID=A0A239L4N8_9BACT|nr:hypothetical protein [Granulicella rosea]SNT25285.1 hypothetical protein SAMN05421770_106100 [Granulicella rosea]
MPQLPLQRRLLAATLLVAGLAPLRVLAAGPKTPQPVAKIPLAEMGFYPTPPRLLFPGGAMFTVNFVDSSHLLVTFNARGLLNRDLNDPPDDQDRKVAALLISYPSGEVLARTEWLTHDHARYLWALPNGRFLLRIRGKVSVIAPLANLPTGDAFREQPYLQSDRRIGLMLLSPGGEMMVVETVANTSTTPQFAESTAADVGISFYRVTPPTVGPGVAGDIARPRYAGSGRFQSMVDIPLTAEGFLDASQEPPSKSSPGGYLFDFYTHSGKKQELAGFDTSCRPTAVFLSRSEFIGFGCRGSADKPELGAFNLKGDPLWVESVPNGVRTAYLATAPEVGRFGLSRLIFTAGTTNPQPDEIGVSNVESQQITVIQTWSGQELLKLSTTPVHGNGQNYDLSADGQSLVLLRDDTLELYQLPPLSDKDKAAVAEAVAAYPQRETALVTLRRSGPKTAEELAKEAVKPAETPLDTSTFRIPARTDADPLSTLQIVGDQGAAPPPPPGDAPEVQGDQPHRKPPTLLLPGETPEDKK